MKKYKFAFTLFEVLITIGIIGAVAAITIPTMISNYQNKKYQTSAVVDAAKVQQNFELMNAAAKFSRHKNTEEFVEAMKEYGKIVRTCSKNEISKCFYTGENLQQKIKYIYINDPVNDVNKTKLTQAVQNNCGYSAKEAKEVVNKYVPGYFTCNGSYSNLIKELKGTGIKCKYTEYPSINELISKNLGHESWGTEPMAVEFINNFSAILTYNPKCKQAAYTRSMDIKQCVEMLIDVTNSNNPNMYGKDVRWLKDILYPSSTGDVIVTDYGSATKVQLIKLCRQYTGLGLREAKEIIENLPWVITIDDIGEDKLQELIEELDSLGADYIAE